MVKLKFGILFRQYIKHFVEVKMEETNVNAKKKLSISSINVENSSEELQTRFIGVLKILHNNSVFFVNIDIDISCINS